MTEYNYDDFCPIDKTIKSVIIDTDEKGDRSKLCMKTGYHSFSVWENLEQLENHERIIPQFVRDTRIDDDNGNIWFKIILVSPFAILFPEPNGTWNLSKIVPVTDEHSGNVFLWEGKPFMVDNDDFKIFDEFSDAFNTFNYIFNLSVNDTND